jgi:hypothetical protein
MIKIETTKNFLGFGNGTKKGEYFFSQRFNKTKDGIAPNWEIRAGIDSASLATLLTPGFFAQIKIGIDTYGYVVNRTTAGSNGKIFRAIISSDSWTLQNTTTVTSYGNGLITDQKGRLLYLQTRYLGMFNGATWYDTWKDFGASSLPNDSDFRPSDLYEDWVVMGNGNDIALLNTVDDSFNATAFTLPDQFLIQAIRSNRTGVLIGANFETKGALVLWDCLATSAITPWIWLDDNISAITRWGDLWIVVAGNKTIVTNGYSYKELAPLPDILLNDFSYNAIYPSGISVKDNYLLLSADLIGLGRKKKGLWILNLLTLLWEFCPVYNGCLIGVTIGGIFNSTLGNIYIGYATAKPAKYYIGRLYQTFDGAGSYVFISPVFGQGDTKKVGEAVIISLNPNYSPQYAFATPDPNYKLTLKVYEFNRRLFNYATTNAVSTSLNKLKINGSSRSALSYQVEIGDEVTILDGINASSIKHITAFTGKGTASEVWTLDSDLAAMTESGVYLEICPFRKIATQTLNTYKWTDYYFDIGHNPIGKKFLVKAVLECAPGAGILKPEITSLSFIYNDLGIP